MGFVPLAAGLAVGLLLASVAPTAEAVPPEGKGKVKGVEGVHVHEASYAVINGGRLDSGPAYCDAGEVLLGGSLSFTALSGNPNEVNNVVIHHARAHYDAVAERWFYDVGAAKTGGTGNATVEVRAICAPGSTEANWNQASTPPA